MSSLPVTDFHSHILPGVDDGSKDIEMSLSMLRRMKQQGVDVCVATPHYYSHHRTVASFLERRSNAWNGLRERMDDFMPEVRLGAEVAVSDRLLETPDIERLCIEGTKTLLLEMPFSQWTDEDLDLVSTLCLDRGLRVVLVHLERFLDLQHNRDILERVLSLPLSVQVNAEALISLRERRTALRLFADGSACLLGSDAHNMKERAPNLDRGRSILKRHFGDAMLDKVDARAYGLLTPEGTV